MRVLAVFALTITFSILSQAKPVVSVLNVKSFLDSVKISIVEGGKYQTFKVTADAYPMVSGDVRLVNPKLVQDRHVYGIEMDAQTGTGVAPHYKAVLAISNSICASMDRKAAVNRAGELDTVVYPSLVPSLRVHFAGGNGILVFRGEVSSQRQQVISSIVCE